MHIVPETGRLSIDDSTPLGSRVSFSQQRLGCDAVEIEGVHRRDALTQPLEGVLGGKN
jgi:hypothetical protein